MTQKLLVVQATFHQKEMETMLTTAQNTAAECGLKIGKVVSVPGCMEIPFALHKNLLKEEFSGAVVLGIIERGETKHGLTMAQAVISSIINIQMQANKPIGVGILGPEINPSQIPPRLEGYASAAVKAVDHMLKLE